QPRPFDRGRGRRVPGHPFAKLTPALDQTHHVAVNARIMDAIFEQDSDPGAVLSGVGNELHEDDRGSYRLDHRSLMIYDCLRVGISEGSIRKATEAAQWLSCTDEVQR